MYEDTRLRYTSYLSDEVAVSTIDQHCIGTKILIIQIEKKIRLEK
jgi:hypothetical protein